MHPRVAAGALQGPGASRKRGASEEYSSEEWHLVQLAGLAVGDGVALAAVGGAGGGACGACSASGQRSVAALVALHQSPKQKDELVHVSDGAGALRINATRASVEVDRRIEVARCPDMWGRRPNTAKGTRECAPDPAACSARSGCHPPDCPGWCRCQQNPAAHEVMGCSASSKLGRQGQVTALHHSCSPATSGPVPGSGCQCVRRGCRWQQHCRASCRASCPASCPASQ